MESRKNKYSVGTTYILLKGIFDPVFIQKLIEIQRNISEKTVIVEDLNILLKK